MRLAGEGRDLSSNVKNELDLCINLSSRIASCQRTLFRFRASRSATSSSSFWGVPHFQRAIRVHRELRRKDAGINAVMQALACLDAAAFVTDERAKRAMEKADVRRQAELVALVLSIPTARGAALA